MLTLIASLSPGERQGDVPVGLIEFFWAPLAVGVLLWIVAEGVRWVLATVRQRRLRRWKIVSLMGQAEALCLRAIRDGVMDAGYVSHGAQGFAQVRDRYDDLTAEALDLFQRGEEEVAFWAAVEFYAGWWSPHVLAEKLGVPRLHPTDGTLIFQVSERTVLGAGVDETGSPVSWTLARPDELVDWADVMWPWERGNAWGPRFGDLVTPADSSRHDIVTPNSDSAPDMLRPFILRIGSAFGEVSAREKRRLAIRYSGTHPRPWRSYRRWADRYRAWLAERKEVRRLRGR
ncbi:hypothetical protein GCM10022200_05350 [Microbacterium awajiense]|uniref:Uncharacterized protein n=1 Tax=Microbacterium awajiense TaxID=415214 RepID=A0ABP7A6T2_9MICO